LNFFFFKYVNKIIRIAKDKTFDFNCLHKLEDELQFKHLYPKFKVYLKKELEKPKQEQIYYILINFLVKEHVLGSWLISLSYLLQFPIPIVVREYLD